MGSGSGRKAFLHMRTGHWNMKLPHFLLNQLGEIDGSVRASRAMSSVGPSECVLVLVGGGQFGLKGYYTVVL